LFVLSFLTFIFFEKAAAAVGQGRLMRIYDDLFSQFNQVIAQVLLTRNDISEVIFIFY